MDSKFHQLMRLFLFFVLSEQRCCCRFFDLPPRFAARSWQSRQSSAITILINNEQSIKRLTIADPSQQPPCCCWLSCCCRTCCHSDGAFCWCAGSSRWQHRCHAEYASTRYEVTNCQLCLWNTDVNGTGLILTDLFLSYLINDHVSFSIRVRYNNLKSYVFVFKFIFYWTY